MAERAIRFLGFASEGGSAGLAERGAGRERVGQRCAADEHGSDCRPNIDVAHDATSLGGGGTTGGCRGPNSLHESNAKILQIGDARVPPRASTPGEPLIFPERRAARIRIAPPNAILPIN